MKALFAVITILLASSSAVAQATNARSIRLDRIETGTATVPARNGWNVDLVDAVESGFAQDVCIVGSYAYVAFYKVLSVFDITNAASPVRVGFAPTTEFVSDICHHGNYLYCCNYDSAVQIFDITIPTVPNLVATIPVQGNRVDVEGQYLYAEDGLGVRVFSVANPANPVSVAYIPSANVHSIYDIEAVGAYLYVGRNASLQIVNIANPANPVELSVLPVAGSPYVLASVSAQYLYATTFSAGPALRVIDVANPLAPTIAKEVGLGAAYDMDVYEDHVYLLGTDVGDDIRVFDVSDPLNPVALPGFSACEASDVCIGIGNDIAVVGDYNGTLCFLNVSNPAAPASLSSYEPLPSPLSLDVSAGHLAVSSQYGRLAWIDRFDTSSRQLILGHSGFGIDGSHVVVRGNYAFVAMNDFQYNDDNGLQIFDISDPAQPAPMGYLYTPWLSSFSVGANHVYLPVHPSMWVIDVSNPMLPAKVGELALSAFDVFAAEPYLFASSGGNLRVIDVSDPTAPFVATSLPLAANSFGLWVEESLVYISTGTTLWIVSVSNPLQPMVVGSFPTSSLWSVRVRGQFAYLSDYPLLRILDITNPGLPVEVGNIETTGIDSRVAVAPPHIYAVTEFGPLLKYQTPWITDVRQGSSRRFALKQNYPNPFNPSTTIAFEIPAGGRVRLDIFDVRGTLVRRLLDESMPAGIHSTTWDGRDSAGTAAVSGVYFYRLEADGKSEAKKMVILK